MICKYKTFPRLSAEKKVKCGKHKPSPEPWEDKSGGLWMWSECASRFEHASSQGQLKVRVFILEVKVGLPEDKNVVSVQILCLLIWNTSLYYNGAV